jgi:hypothetical protein
MVLDVDYFEAIALFTHREHFKANGLGHLTLDRQLTRAGYAVARRYPEKGKRWPPSPFATTHICRVRTAEMKGPRAVHHYVVMSQDGLVYDPDKPGIHSLADYPRVLDVAGLFRV